MEALLEAMLRRDWAAVSLDALAAVSVEPPSTWRAVGEAITLEAAQLFSSAMDSLGAVLARQDGAPVVKVWLEYMHGCVSLAVLDSSVARAMRLPLTDSSSHLWWRAYRAHWSSDYVICGACTSHFASTSAPWRTSGP